MPYQPRVQFPGAIYHVASRGNGQQAIFTDSEDRMRFFSILACVTERCDWRIFAYCLMGNHYHILLETPLPNLSEGMRDLNSSYALWFNKKSKRIGHMVQGRYYSSLVEKESYFLEVARYIVLNPVRAGIVYGPEEWRWSSYQAMFDEQLVPVFLSPQGILRFFSSDRRQAMKEYREFVIGGLEKAREHAIEGKLGIEELLQHGPGEGSQDDQICKAYFDHHYSMSEIASALGLSCSTISRILSRYRKQAS